MSTKIYNAYIVKDLNIESLIQVLREIKVKYFNHCIKLLKEESYIFKEAYNIRKSHRDIYKQIMSSIISQINDIENIEATCVVYFHKNKIYIQFSGVPYEIINQYKFFQDFHYQNSSDMSNYTGEWKNLTSKEKSKLRYDWHKRKRIWDEILPGSGVPSECGLSYEFIREFDITKIAIEVSKKLDKNDLR